MKSLVLGRSAVAVILVVFVLGAAVFSKLYLSESRQARIVGYFPYWASYREGRSMSSIDTKKLSHFIYGYFDLDSNGDLQVGDSFSALQQNQATTKGGKISGNLNAFQQLKIGNENLKVMVAVGGWNWSKNFSTVLKNPLKRQHFIESALEYLNTYGFDGYQFDWRNPEVGGAAGNSRNPNDMENYLFFLQELSSACEEQNLNCEISITVPAMPHARPSWNFQELAKYVNFFTVLTSDFVGSWSQRTGHKAPLYKDSAHPQASIASIVREIKSAGLPAEKLVLYVSVDGTSWKGVSSENDGLHQGHSGVPYGTWDNNETGPTGVVAYREIESLIDSGEYQLRWDESVAASSLYSSDKQQFITFESVDSLQEKLIFSDAERLGGIALWEMTGDADNGNGLLDKIYGHYHSISSYQITLQRWLAKNWPLIASLLTGSIVTLYLMAYILRRRRLAGEWLEREEFVGSIQNLSENLNQIVYLALVPPAEFHTHLSKSETNTLENIAINGMAVIHQIRPLVELTQPKTLSEGSQADALLSLQKFTDLLSSQLNVDAMLDTMFTFLMSDSRVQSAQLSSSGEVTKQYGKPLLEQIPAEKFNGELLALNQRRDLAKVDNIAATNFQLALKFTTTLSDIEEAYFRGLCNQVLFACQQIRKLFQQPQLLADICTVAQRRDKLLFIKGEKGYSGVHASDLKEAAYIYLRLRILLQYFPELLVQVHRSYLINPDAVTGVERKKSGYVLCLGKERVPVSRSYLAELKLNFSHWFEMDKAS